MLPPPPLPSQKPTVVGSHAIYDREILTFSPVKLQSDVSDYLLYHLHSSKQQGGKMELSTRGGPKTWHRITKGQTRGAAIQPPELCAEGLWSFFLSSQL